MVVTFDVIYKYKVLCFSQVIPGKWKGLVGGVDQDLLFPNPIPELNIQALKVFFQTRWNSSKNGLPWCWSITWASCWLNARDHFSIFLSFYLQDPKGPCLLVNFSVTTPFCRSWKYLLVQVKALSPKVSYFTANCCGQSCGGPSPSSPYLAKRRRNTRPDHCLVSHMPGPQLDGW